MTSVNIQQKSSKRLTKALGFIEKIKVRKSKVDWQFKDKSRKFEI